MKLSQPKMIRLGMVLAGVVAIYTLFTSYSASKGAVVDKMVDLGGLGVQGPLSDQGPSMAFPHSVGGNAASTSGMQGRTPSTQQTYTETVLDSSELLPKGALGAAFDGVTPVGADDLKGQNFLQAGYHTNTNVIGVSQTNRNPPYDIRAEPPNPQMAVGPFLNSTIEVDPLRSQRALDGLTA